MPGTPPNRYAPASINWNSQCRLTHTRSAEANVNGSSAWNVAMLPNPLPGTQMPPNVGVKQLLAAEEKRRGDCKQDKRIAR